MSGATRSSCSSPTRAARRRTACRDVHAAHAGGADQRGDRRPPAPARRGGWSAGSPPSATCSPRPGPSYGADRTSLVATSAVRDAANGQEFHDRVRSSPTGVHASHPLTAMRRPASSGAACHRPGAGRDLAGLLPLRPGRRQPRVPRLSSKTVQRGQPAARLRAADRDVRHRPRAPWTRPRRAASPPRSRPHVPFRAQRRRVPCHAAYGRRWDRGHPHHGAGHGRRERRRSPSSEADAR
jgi:hypothetical protein